MNPEFVTTFREATANLMAVWGGPALHTSAATQGEATVSIVLDTQAVPVGEFGERMELQTTVQIAASSGAAVGDTFTVASDPTPVIWTAVQLLSDDSYLRTFAVRKEP